MRKQVCIWNPTIKACGKTVRQMKSDPSALIWAPLHVYTSFISMEMVFCYKLFSLSLSLLWAQWEDNCGILVGIPLCQMPGPLNLIQLMHSNVSDGPQKLIAIRCFKKNIRKPDALFGILCRHFRSTRMPPTCAPQERHVKSWHIDLGPKERWLSDLKGPFSRLIHPINVQEPTRHLPLSAWPILLDSAVRPVWVAMQHVTWVAGKHWKT